MDDFAVRFQKTLATSLERRKARVWQRGLQDLQEITDQASTVLQAITEAKLLLRLADFGTAAEDGNLLDRRVVLVDFVTGETIGELDRYLVYAGGCYPVIRANEDGTNMLPIGDREGLQLQFLGRAANPTSGLISEIGVALGFEEKSKIPMHGHGDKKKK